MILTVERLGHRGDGIAQGPDGPVRVAMALPGEVVEGEPEAGRIAAPRILTPSPDRVRAPCAHFRACGGCSLQHASDPFVAGWKAQAVLSALSARGIAAEVAAVRTSPPRSRRRAVLAGRRTKKGVTLGFHARASDTVVEIADCHLLHPALMAALPVLRAVVAAGASRKGGLDLTVTHSSGGIDLAVAGGKPMDAGLFQTLAALAEGADLARLTWEGEPVATRRPPAQEFGRARVVPPPGGFLQATQAGEAALVAAVRAHIGAARQVADLFAGAGTFALPLAETAEVHAVEGEAAPLAALQAGWRQAPGLRRVTVEARDLFRRPLLPDELAGFDAVVIDPPRAGCEAQAAELARSSVPVIAAVSCNPVTFARDAQTLIAGGYRMGPVTVVDQFRWSPHVELVAPFRR
ncbi:class I SAM-dependent RNA methyltransferase [Frigidibacter oleivorans]|uniref:class I SAM-dependent RNA methyltransferase n=1 Tax=Frigidibacter oleivorans TaxID=2487129 RepID=UPI000F8ECD13|nr:class I SAM-dependent RNA methyltransferase [Frigidibacter oleivorans]